MTIQPRAFSTPDFSTLNFSTPWFKKFMVEKFSVEKFMVEKSGVEKFLLTLGLNCPGLKLGVEKSRVEMSCNPQIN